MPDILAAGLRKNPLAAIMKFIWMPFPEGALPGRGPIPVRVIDYFLGICTHKSQFSAVIGFNLTPFREVVLPGRGENTVIWSV
jgi:hypothetical protein